MFGKLKKDIPASIPSWAPICAILTVTALIYSRALFNTLTNFDDSDFILNNPLIKDTSWEGIKVLFTSAHSGKYQPLVNFSFLLEHKFFGFNPVIFHLTNVLLHLACTWVVYKFTERLSGGKITALVVAALFALHPMHVEEVAWASERKDVLYAVFYLLALLYYVKYLEPGFRAKYYVAVCLFFILSLFSKSSAITLPVVLVLIDIYKGRKLNSRMWLEKVPFIVIAVLYQVFGSLLHHAEAGYHLPEGLSFINRVFLITSVPAFYITRLFAPFGLSAMHYYPDIIAGRLPWAYYVSLPLLLLVGCLFIKRTPFRKEMLFGMAFFLVTISVMEQIVSVGPSLTPERYTYIPYIGLFYIIGRWLSNTATGKQRNFAFGVFALFLIMFSVQTWARIAVWKDSDSVFMDVLDHNEGSKDCYYIYLQRGDLRMSEGDLRDALEDYNQSIVLDPFFAQSYNNRAAAFFQAGDLKSALNDFNRAIKLDPKSHRPYDNRASLEASLGDFGDAVADYNYYLQLEPADSRAYADRGMARLSLRDSSGACQDWKRAMELGDETAPKLLGQFCH